MVRLLYAATSSDRVNTFSIPWIQLIILMNDYLDEDECEREESPCPLSQTCTNLVGTYTCLASEAVGGVGELQ